MELDGSIPLSSRYRRSKSKRQLRIVALSDSSKLRNTSTLARLISCVILMNQKQFTGWLVESSAGYLYGCIHQMREYRPVFAWNLTWIFQNWLLNSVELIKEKPILSFCCQSGESRNAVNLICSGCRIRHPGLDPGPARRFEDFWRNQ